MRRKTKKSNSKTNSRRDESFELSFQDNGIFLIRIIKEERLPFELPFAQTKYDLAYSLVDGIVSRFLNDKFSWKTDNVARYYRVAFALLIGELIPTQKQHKQNLKGDIEQYDVCQFMLVKATLDVTTGRRSKLKDKMKFLGISKEKNTSYSLQGYWSEDSDRPVDESESEDSLIAVATQTRVPDESGQANLEGLFEKISQADEQSSDDDDKQDWKKVRIPGFRGINYMVSRFSNPVRHQWHQNGVMSKKTELDSFSEAALMSCTDFYRDENSVPNIFDKESQLYKSIKNNAMALNKQLQRVKNTDYLLVVGLSGGGRYKIFTNLLDVIQHIYSNGIIKAQRFFHNYVENSNKRNLDFHLPNGYNPFVSESEMPEHAVRYALGLKDLYTPAALKPRYDKNGRPSFPYLGEVSITLRGLRDEASFEHVRELIREKRGKGSLEPSRYIAPELEATARGYIPANQIFYSEVVKCPNFSGHFKNIYLPQFGLNRVHFNNFKKRIIQTDPGTEDRMTVVKELLDHLCQHYSQMLMSEAKRLAGDNDFDLVFLDSSHQLTLDKPNNTEINSATKLEKDRRKRLAGKLYDVLREDNVEPIISDIYLTTKPLKIFEFDSDRLKKTMQQMEWDEEDIDKFLEQEDKLRTPPGKKTLSRIPLMSQSQNSQSPYRKYHRPKLGDDMLSSKLDFDQSLDDEDVSSEIRTTSDVVNSLLKLSLFSGKPKPLSDKGGLTEKAKQLSLDSYNEQLKKHRDKIGQRHIKGWSLKDVEDKGNCFYLALANQLEILKHEILKQVPDTTETHDLLRLRIQGAQQFKDLQYADFGEISQAAKILNLIIAIVDTRDENEQFIYYYTSEEGVTHSKDGRELPQEKPIVKLAFTGNHYLSVSNHPSLDSQEESVAPKGG